MSPPSRPHNDVWPPPPLHAAEIVFDETIESVRLICTDSTLSIDPVGKRREFGVAAIIFSIPFLIYLILLCWLMVNLIPLVVIYGLHKALVKMPGGTFSLFFVWVVIALEMLWISLYFWSRCRNMLYTLDRAKNVFRDGSKLICSIEQAALKIRARRPFYRPGKATYMVSIVQPSSRSLLPRSHGRLLGHFRHAENVEKVIQRVTEFADIEVIRVDK